MGARMQERWFQGQVRKKQTPGSEKLPLDCRIISTSWALSQSDLKGDVENAVGKATLGLRSGGGFIPNQPDKQALRRIAEKALGKSLPENAPQPFPTKGFDHLNKLQQKMHGKPAKTADSIEDWVYRIEKSNTSVPILTVTDVDAALGVYYVWVIPSGMVVRKGNEYHFTITGMGWCLWDSFDFGKGDNDDQNLGAWDFNRQLGPFPSLGNWSIVSIHQGHDPAFRKVQGLWEVRNRTYRAFQNKWNKGEDFVILSDISTKSLGKNPVSKQTPITLRISIR